MLKKILTLLGLFFVTYGGMLAQSPYFEAFKLMKNKKDITVNTIYQDKSGFVWIATNQGLIRYNGIDFTPITSLENLVKNEITAVVQDLEGVIWFGHKNGKISKFDGTTFTQFEPEEGSSNAEISGFMVSKTNTIWFTTFGEGVYYWGGKNRKRIYNINTDDGLPDNYTYSVVEGVNSNIYIATDKGICVYDTAKHAVVDSITMSDGLPDNIVKHLCFTNDRKLWIGMEDGGICSYDTGSKKFNVLNNWTFGSINNFVIANPNEFWISTKRKGVVKLTFDSNGAAWLKSFGKNHGLISNQTRTVYLDQEHNIWIGSKEGLAIRKNNHIEFLDARDNFNIKNIYSIAFDKNGSIWIASQDGLYKVIQSETGELTTTKLFDISKISLLSFISVYCDSKGFIWAGTYGYGVYRVNPNNLQYQVFTSRDGLANNNVISISGKNDTILFSTLGGGLSITNINELNRFSTFSMDKGLTSNYIYTAFIDSGNRIWMATDGGGIACMSKGVIQKYQDTNDSLFSQVFYSIVEDSKGRIWLASADRGVYVYNGTTFTNINEMNGLRTNSVRSISKTSDGRIVLVSNEGLDVYDPQSETFEYWGEEDRVAYLEPNLNAIQTDKTGNIWVGTQDGIMILSSTLDSGIQKEPRLLITNKLVYSNPIPENKQRFNFRQNYFTFHYIGLWYKAPEKLLYRYKLEGADMDWSAPTRNLQVTYSNLTDGHYTFKVEVSYIPGKWIGNANAVYSFTINPPIYKRWWFIMILVVIAIISVFSYIKYRTAKLERDKDILEEEVRKRTYEIQMQKEEIETQRDEIELQHQFVTKQRDQIASQNRDIKSSIEYASRIQHAMLPPEELIGQYFAEYFILYKPRDIVSGDFYYFNLRDGKVVFAAVDSTGHGVPGAFMSMLGLTLINDVVNDIADFKASLILSELRTRVKRSLRQKGYEGETRDGMDISLCVFDPETLRLNYAGAYNPLLIVRNNELITYNADKMPIGVFPKEDPFSDNFIDVVKNDMVYVFSDGYHDQLGGERNTKFLLKNFKTLLVDIAVQPAEVQKQILTNKIDSWKGNYPQTDDMLVIGIRI